MKILSELMLLIFIFLCGLNTYASQKYECPQSKAGTAHGNLGAKLWESGKYIEAENETRIAIKNDPNCSMWRQNQGFILKDMGKYDEANVSLLKSLEVDNYWCTASKTGSLMEIAWFYYSKRDYKRSIKYFNSAIEMASKENIDNNTKALIYTRLSYNYTDPSENGNRYYNLTLAEKYKKMAINLNPNDMFLKASYTKLLVLRKRMPEARKYLSEIINYESKSSKPDSSVYSYLAHIYSVLNEPKEAALYIKKAIELNPKYEANYLISELNRDFKNVSNSKEMLPVIEKARNISK